MKIALVSLNQAWEDKKTNLDLCEKYIQKSSGENVNLIVFPEMTLTGFSINIGSTAEDFVVELVAGGSYLAATYKIRLLFYLRYKKLGFWRYFKSPLV